MKSVPFGRVTGRTQTKPCVRCGETLVCTEVTYLVGCAKPATAWLAPEHDCPPRKPSSGEVRP